MDTPARDDEPVESWEYQDHQCHVYSSDDPVDGETLWAGYTRTKLPESAEPDDRDFDVPGELTYGIENGWLGFSVHGGSRDVAQTREEVERLVDQVVELEASMDG